MRRKIEIWFVPAVVMLLFFHPAYTHAQGNKPKPNLQERTPFPTKASLAERNPKANLAERTPLPGTTAATSATGQSAPSSKMSAFIIRRYATMPSTKFGIESSPKFNTVNVPKFCAECVDPDLIGMNARGYNFFVAKADAGPKFNLLKLPVYDRTKIDPDRIRPTEKLSTLPYVANLKLPKDSFAAPIAVAVKFTYPKTQLPKPDPEPEMTTLASRGNSGSAGGMEAPRLSKKKIPKPQRIDLTERTPLPVRESSMPVGNAKPVAGTTTSTTSAPPPKDNSNWNNGMPVIYDTMRTGSRKRYVPVEIYVSHKDTIYIYPADYEEPPAGGFTVKNDASAANSSSGISISGSKEGYCNCMELVMTADDTIDFEDYVNYGFTFKNKCKEYVFLHSGSFKFNVYGKNGMPAKRVRRIDFVKRFDYPEYVRINPGESYEYHFADDPFFEYDLSRGVEYKFTFMYNNYANRYAASPNKTYMCNQPADKIIYVR